VIPILSISWGIFFENKGDNLVTFEIMELEKVKKIRKRQLLKEVDDFVDENDAMEVSELQRRKPLPLLLKWRKLK
jgi:DNA polymerase-3 subunit alpha